MSRAENTPPLLEVQGLAKSFGGVHAVQDVGFRVQTGQMVALIGPNGAGKSTCFNLVNGQLAPDRGAVHLQGQAIQGRPPREIWRLGVGRTFQIPATFHSLSVLENLQVALAAQHGRSWRLWRPLYRQYQDQALALLEQVGMAAQARRLGAELAYGDVKRVELAIALAGSPRLLLMDEPTAGMAPHERHALMDLTRQLVEQHGLGVLFTEHSLDVVFRHADHMVVMVRGKVLASGAPTDVAANPDVRAAYLGNFQTL